MLKFWLGGFLVPFTLGTWSKCCIALSKQNYRKQALAQKQFAAWLKGKEGHPVLCQDKAKPITFILFKKVCVRRKRERGRTKYQE